MQENDLTNKPQKHTTTIILKWCLYLITGWITLSVLLVVSLRWINPPSSSIMFQHKISIWWSGQESTELEYQWVDWEEISDWVKMAAITSEDQRFPFHKGFDFTAIQEALQENREGDGLRGASTISQQVAKNLFLWNSRSFIRKGVEAWFTLLIELFWSKSRILEIYLNIAQFGEQIYGVGAAGLAFFNTPASELDLLQSALLVTALPSPTRYNVRNPSTYMIERRNWVLRYMFLLGNTEYLNQL